MPFSSLLARNLEKQCPVSKRHKWITMVGGSNWEYTENVSVFVTWSSQHVFFFTLSRIFFTKDIEWAPNNRYLMATFCRALELALSYKKTHLDTVLWYRQKYLQKTKHEETKEQFIHFAQQVATSFCYWNPTCIVGSHQLYNRLRD